MTTTTSTTVTRPPRPASGSVDELRDALRRLGRVVVAFSGGADSSLLAKVAQDTLGRGLGALRHGALPSLAGAEEADCRALAEEWDLRWVGVPTSEMEDAAYVANGPDRCARCKSALMEALGPLAAAEGATVVLGVNVSDLGDHRPGQAAAAEAGAVFPLVEAGFTKDDIRRLVPRARAAHLGQAGGGLPGLAPALRHAGDAGPPGRRRSGRVGAALARLRPAAGAPPRRCRPPGGRARRAGRGAGPPGRGGRRRARRWLPLRRSGPGRLPFRQPEPWPGPGRGRVDGSEEAS